MKHIIASGMALILNGACAYAQGNSTVPLDEQVARQLETDAASALSRGFYIDMAQEVCRRGAAEDAAQVARAHQAWTSRNRGFLTASASAIKAIAQFKTGTAEGDQYLRYQRNASHDIMRHALKELNRDFEGANPDNKKPPPSGRCTQLAQGLDQGRVDFVNTPTAIASLRQYMERVKAQAPQPAE